MQSMALMRQQYLTSISNVETFNSEQVMENTGEKGTYIAQMNFVKREDSSTGAYNYVPFYDGIVYNGGEFEFYAEFTFSGDRSSIKSMDAIALLFIDGYIQEFSLENGETAFVHNVTVPNNKMARIGFSFVPTTYDADSDKHTIVAVILPNWVTGYGNFISESAVMAVGREITLNAVNVPEEDNIVKMKTREKTSWDTEHSELPFKQDGSNTNPVFHCFDLGETYCYLFCGGELFSYEGKCIFAADNKDEDTVSYFGVSLNDSDIGKPLYVLYVPKEYGGSVMVRTTCNYLWTES